MSTLIPLNGWFMFAVGFTAIAVMAYWWVTTRGSWMQWPAGRSLMGLLAIIAVIACWAGLNTMILPPRYDGKIISYMALYAILEVSLIIIGSTIHREMTRGRARDKYRKEPKPATGSIDISVASQKDTNDD